MVTLSPPSKPLAPADERLYRLAAGLLFFIVAFVYYWPSLNWLPRGIHEWAQADRLALAISYYDHGLNFFRPQTLSLSSIDGVVGVEFPLVAYLAALGAKVVGRASLVPLYRLLTIAAAWLAYYYLFKLVFERTRQFMAALLPGIFLATSPVFAYYAGNFLPDPVSTAFVVVASYYLLRYQQTHSFRDVAIAIPLFTLAALLKISAGTYLVAALSTMLLWSYLQPSVLTVRQRVLLLLLAGASLGAIVGYTLYNRHLNETYQSTLFLATARPFESADQYHMVVDRMRHSWSHEYFVLPHYLLLLGSVLVCLASAARIARAEWLWAVQIGLAIIGGGVFFRFMGMQFYHHDYYVLAPFWPMLVLLVALATTQLAQRLVVPRRLPQALFGVALVALLGFGLHRYRDRMAEPYLKFSDYYTYHWMQGGAAQLAAAHVPSDATILVVGEEPPNLSLVYFDRRGLVWKPDMSQLNATNLLQKLEEVGFGYVVMRQEVFQELAHGHPDVTAVFNSLINTPQYVVLKPLGAPKH
jgi:4-amino-4-deoxy-L-arabinose transferase-like glycosyltransferase